MKPRRSVIALGALALLVLLASLWLAPADAFDVATLSDRLANVPSWMVLLVLLGAPLLGTPLSALLVLVGARFPLPIALALVVAVLIVHHLLIFLLRRTRWHERLRQPLAARGLLPSSTDAHRRLADDLLFILAATWIPGLSYIFKVALTALAGIPLRTYLVVGVASQAIAALPYLLAGRVAQDLDLRALGMAIFATLAALWLIGRYTTRRLGTRAGTPGVPEP